MAVAWQQHCSSMAGTWRRHGSNVAATFRRHGGSEVPVKWQQHEDACAHAARHRPAARCLLEAARAAEHAAPEEALACCARGDPWGAAGVRLCSEASRGARLSRGFMVDEHRLSGEWLRVYPRLVQTARHTHSLDSRFEWCMLEHSASRRSFEFGTFWGLACGWVGLVARRVGPPRDALRWRDIFLRLVRGAPRRASARLAPFTGARRGLVARTAASNTNLKMCARAIYLDERSGNANTFGA